MQCWALEIGVDVLDQIQALSGDLAVVLQGRHLYMERREDDEGVSIGARIGGNSIEGQMIIYIGEVSVGAYRALWVNLLLVPCRFVLQIDGDQLDLVLQTLHKMTHGKRRTGFQFFLSLLQLRKVGRWKM